MKVRFIKSFLANNFKKQLNGQNYIPGKEYSIVSTIEEINETSISVAMANVAVENDFAEYVEVVTPIVIKDTSEIIDHIETVPAKPAPRKRPARKRKRK